MNYLVITFSAFAIIFLVFYYRRKIKKTEELVTKGIKHEIEILELERKAAQERLTQENRLVETHYQNKLKEIEADLKLQRQQRENELSLERQRRQAELEMTLQQYRQDEETKLLEKLHEKEKQWKDLDAQVKQDLEETRRKGLELLKEEHESVLQNMLKEREEAETLLAPLRAELEEYRRKREAINEDILRSRKLEMEKDFHRIVLDDVTKEDIGYLLSIENKLNNKEVLRKLIWSAYLQGPTTAMLNRVLGKKSPSGIYKITDSIGRVYIGKSTSVRTRWSEHVKSSIKIGGIAHQPIHDEMSKQGIDTFTFELLEECSKQELTEREKYYIDFFEAVTYGYNVKRG